MMHFAQMNLGQSNWSDYWWGRGLKIWPTRKGWGSTDCSAWGGEVSGDLTCVFKHLMGAVKKIEPGCSLQCVVTGQDAMGTKRNAGNSSEVWSSNCSHWGWPNAGTDSQMVLEPFPNLGNTQSLTGHGPKQPAVADPAPSRRWRGAFLPQSVCQLVSPDCHK